MGLKKHDFVVIGVTIVAIAAIYRSSTGAQMLTGQHKLFGIF